MHRLCKFGVRRHILEGCRLQPEATFDTVFVDDSPLECDGGHKTRIADTKHQLILVIFASYGIELSVIVFSQEGSQYFSFLTLRDIEGENA